MFGASRSVPPGPAGAGWGAAGKEVVAVPDGLDEHEQPVEHQEGHRGERRSPPHTSFPDRLTGRGGFAGAEPGLVVDAAEVPVRLAGRRLPAGRLQGGHCSGAEHRDPHPRHHPVRSLAARPATSGPGSTTSSTTSSAWTSSTRRSRRRDIGGRGGRDPRRSGIRGAGVSMPFKEACIPLVDELDAVRGGDQLGEHDRQRPTDGCADTTPTTCAVQRCWPRTRCRRSWSSPCSAAGGWPRRSSRPCATAASPAARWSRRGTRTRRGALAEQYGFDAAVGAPPSRRGCWSTPRRSAWPGGPQEHDLSFARELVDAAEVVFDVVALPPQTPLVRLGAERG